jgi:hypothetical protein
MGRTFTVNKPLPLYLGPKQLSVSWESNPARVKASKRIHLVYKLKIFLLHNNKGNLIQRTSGYTGLLWWNSSGFESVADRSPFDRSITLFSYPSSFIGMPKIFIFFFFLSRIFVLVKNTYKNPYSWKAVNKKARAFERSCIVVSQ